MALRDDARVVAGGDMLAMLTSLDLPEPATGASKACRGDVSIPVLATSVRGSDMATARSISASKLNVR